MAAALRFAARRIFGRALERPPQVVLTAAKELAQKRTIHSGSSLRWPFSSSSQSSATLLSNNKAAVAGPSSTVYADLLKAATGSALAGLAVGSLVLSPMYVSMIKRRGQRRAAEKEHRDWLRLNERYT